MKKKRVLEIFCHGVEDHTYDLEVILEPETNAEMLECTMELLKLILMGLRAAESAPKTLH